MRARFDHENLRVYQESLRFTEWASDLSQRIHKGLAVRDQLDRASTSVPLNIAEGNGKFTARDRCRHLDIARGSALECAACLDILVATKQFSAMDVHEGRECLLQIVSMLIGLIKAISENRVGEDLASYEPQGDECPKERE